MCRIKQSRYKRKGFLKITEPAFLTALVIGSVTMRLCASVKIHVVSKWKLTPPTPPCWHQWLNATFVLCFYRLQDSIFSGLQATAQGNSVSWTCLSVASKRPASVSQHHMGKRVKNKGFDMFLEAPKTNHLPSKTKQRLQSSRVSLISPCRLFQCALKVKISQHSLSPPPVPMQPVSKSSMKTLPMKRQICKSTEENFASLISAHNS